MRQHGIGEEPARFLSPSSASALDSALDEMRFDFPHARDTHVRDAHLRDGRQPHGVEQAVQRQLLANPELKFSSLVIRRIRDGVCLEGFIEGAEGLSDACRLARTVDGVNQVLNHLVVRQPAKH